MVFSAEHLSARCTLAGPGAWQAVLEMLCDLVA